MRIGDTVRRTASAATPAVHELLRHLEAKGFDGAPRALGFDEQGREVLSYIEGTVSLDDAWPDVLHHDDGLAAVVQLIERFHDAVADYARPDLAPGQIVCHGDPGPWNIVWSDDTPIGLIDWDFALPAVPLYDVSYVAFEMVPLRDDDRCAWSGSPTSRIASGASASCATPTVADATPATLIDLAERHQLADIDEIEELGPQGVEPFKTFMDQGLADEARAMLGWLRLHRERLLG